MNAEEETVTTEALGAVAPPEKAVTVNATTLDKIYYSGDGYGYAFCFGLEVPDASIWGRDVWGESDIRYRIDGGAVMQASNGRYGSWGYDYAKSSEIFAFFGQMYLNKNISAGSHTIEVWISRVINKTTTWYHGVLKDVTFVKGEKSATLNYARIQKFFDYSTRVGEVDYISAAAGNSVELYSYIHNPTHSKKGKIVKAELVNSDTGMVVSVLTEKEIASEVLDGIDLRSFDDEGVYMAKVNLPQTPNGMFHVYNERGFSWTEALPEGYYDLRLTVSDGYVSVIQKKYYATNRPAIQLTGYHYYYGNHERYCGEVWPDCRQGEYVAVYIMGPNLTEDIYPVLYTDENLTNAATTFETGNSEPLIWNRGRTYLLKKTSDPAWNKAAEDEDEYLRFYIGFRQSGNAGQLIDGRIERQKSGRNDDYDGLHWQDYFCYQHDFYEYNYKYGIQHAREETLASIGAADAIRFELYEADSLKMVAGGALSAGDADTLINNLIPSTDRTKIDPNAAYRLVAYDANGTVMSKRAFLGFSGAAVVSRVTLSRRTLDMEVDSGATPIEDGFESATLYAYLQPETAAAGQVTWTSSDESVATVSAESDNPLTAKVTAKKTGTAVITVTAQGSGRSATCTVTVCEVDFGEDYHTGDSTGNHRDDYDTEKEAGHEIWIGGISDQTYTGKKITPSVRVYHGKTLLKEKTDYTVSYKNNVNAGDASSTGAGNKSIAPTVVVKLRGNFSGAIEKTFTIKKADLSDSVQNQIIYTWPVAQYKSGLKLSSVTPVVTVNGRKLTTSDATWTFTDPDGNPVTNGKAVKPGVYSVKVAAKGVNYSGSIDTIRVRLTDPSSEALMSKATVAKVTALPYDQNGVRPEPAVTYKLNKMTTLSLEKDKDYTIDYEQNDAVGTATIILTGMGDAGTGSVRFYGEKRVTFKITGTSIGKATVSGIVSLPYTGKAQTQSAMKLTLSDGTVLSENKDYTLVYKNNTKAGKATVTIQGMGAYTGKINKTFQITKVNLADEALVRVTVNGGANVSYLKNGARPAPEVTDIRTGVNQSLVYGTDYTLSWSNNTKTAGKDAKKAPTVVIKGKGSYSGTRKVTFTIAEQDLNNLSMTAADRVYSTKKNAWKSAPALTDLNGKQLKEKTDYEIVEYECDRQVPAVGDVVRVTVRGKNNYTGTATTSYRISKADISTATISVRTQTYTGREIEITSQEQFTKAAIKGKSGQLELGKDFRVIGYANNIKTGTATATIQGIGNYGGIKIVKFKIKAKSAR